MRILPGVLESIGRGQQVRKRFQIAFSQFCILACGDLHENISKEKKATKPYSYVSDYIWLSSELRVIRGRLELHSVTFPCRSRKHATA